jgi:uncharacterized membrane protein YfcA
MTFGADRAISPPGTLAFMRYLLLASIAIAALALDPHWTGLNPTIMLAVAAASVTSSIAGFAFSAICGAMLFHLLDDQVQVVQIMIACSIANQATMVWNLRRDIDLPALVPFVLGGLAGLPLGVWVLLNADHRVYTHLLGAFLIGYGAYALAGKPHKLAASHTTLDAAIGFIGGITGGAAGFPGASMTIWCGMKGWDKTRQRALFQPFILLMQIAALVAISAIKQQQGGTGFAPANLLCIPAGLLGTQLGMALYRRLSNRQFAVAVNVLLVVSGVSYVI